MGVDMIRVLAVDPGERVGWATGTITPLGSHDQRCRLEVTNHGISFLKDAALAIHKAVVIEDRIDVLVYETWVLTAKGARVSVGSDMQSSQFVGMVRLAAWLNPRVQLAPQGPAAKTSALKSMRAHPSGDDIRTRLAALPKAHDDSHDGDALLHLWTYFFNRHV